MIKGPSCCCNDLGPCTTGVCRQLLPIVSPHGITINDLETSRQLQFQADVAKPRKVSSESDKKVVKEKLYHGKISDCIVACQFHSQVLFVCVIGQCSRTANIKKAMCYIVLITLMISCTCCVAQSAAVATILAST